MSSMSSVAARERQQASSKYEMPPIDVGDIVLWYPSGQGNDRPYPAMVTAVGGRTIEFHAQVSGQMMPVRKDGVRHRSDPEHTDWEAQNLGFWDYTQTHRNFLRLMDARAFQASKNVGAQSPNKTEDKKEKSE